MICNSIIFLIVLLIVAPAVSKTSPTNLTESTRTVSVISNQSGAYHSGVYQNLFRTLLGKTEAEVKAKMDSAFNQLFYGDDQNQRVYYPVEPDMAYIKDINNNDIRSEGMS